MYLVFTICIEKAKMVAFPIELTNTSIAKRAIAIQNFGKEIYIFIPLQGKVLYKIDIALNFVENTTGHYCCIE